jgi:hypothetical protein
MSIWLKLYGPWWSMTRLRKTLNSLQSLAVILLKAQVLKFKVIRRSATWRLRLNPNRKILKKLKLQNLTSKKLSKNKPPKTKLKVSQKNKKNRKLRLNQPKNRHKLSWTKPWPKLSVTSSVKPSKVSMFTRNRANKWKESTCNWLTKTKLRISSKRHCWNVEWYRISCSDVLSSQL